MFEVSYSFNETQTNGVRVMVPTPCWAFSMVYPTYSPVEITVLPYQSLSPSLCRSYRVHATTTELL